MSTKAGEKAFRVTNAKSWWRCAASYASRKWKSRSSSELRRISRRRTCSQNDLHLHRRPVFGPAGRDVLSGDEGVDLRLLSVESPAGLGPRLGRRRVDEHDRGHPSDVATFLWQPPGACRAAAWAR